MPAMDSPEKKNYRDKLFLGADGYLFGFARKLRGRETEAEKLLWSRLSRKQLGVKFRRQHPLHSYIVDFYCHSHKLVIEIDGPNHSTKASNFNDRIRSEAFTEFKIEVIRFTNDDVLFDIENVIRKINAYLARYPTR